MSSEENLLNLFRASKDKHDVELFVLLALPIIGKEGIKNMISDYFINNLRAFFKKKMRKKASPELEVILCDMRKDYYNFINDGIMSKHGVGVFSAGLIYSCVEQNWIEKSIFDAIPSLLKYDKYLSLHWGFSNYKLRHKNRVNSRYYFFMLRNDSAVFDAWNIYSANCQTKKISPLR